MGEKELKAFFSFPAMIMHLSSHTNHDFSLERRGSVCIHKARAAVEKTYSRYETLLPPLSYVGFFYYYY